MGTILSRRKKHENQGPKITLYTIDATPTTFPEMENSLIFIKESEQGFYISEDLMDQVYEQQKEIMNGKCLITPQIAKEVKAICKVINEDFCYTLHKRVLNFSLNKIKSLAPFQRIFFEKFVEVAQFSRHKTRQTIDERIVGHFSLIMLLFPIIIQLIEDEDVAVFDLLKQIALYHANMWVKGSDFKVFFVSLLNILIHEEFILKEHIKPIIVFFMTISNYLTKYLDNYCKCRQKEAGLDRYFSRYRKNYRLLKKWNTLVDQLNEEVVVLDNHKNNPLTDANSLDYASDQSKSESLETLAKKTCLFGCFYKDKEPKKEDSI